ncbi:polyhydroxyalkanoic acid system family protein [Sphingomonas sp.]|jgi:hypothetical protein|uniref:polyhydroxyalkanoic acid system family protein n=1 Tax=Sphingomonas sp. TaxID=28214 RepID=UPI003B3B04D6
MSVPVTIDVPHSLGRDRARERMKARVGDLAGHMPGAVGEVHASWPSDYEMALEIGVMGQRIPARMEVQDTVVRVHVSLPPMLAMFSGMIGAAVRSGGEKMLEDHSKA